MNRGVKVVIAIYAVHWGMGAATASSTVRGWAGMVSSGMVLSTNTTGGFFILAHCGWMAKLAAVATLGAWTEGKIFI